MDTEYVFCRTIIPNTRGNSSTLSTWKIISRAAGRGPRAVSWIANRRPPGTRSSHGPISGATMANGATEISWNSRTLLRAASGLLMNTEPTSTAAIAESPAAISACDAGQRWKADIGAGTLRLPRVDRHVAAVAGRRRGSGRHPTGSHGASAAR